MTAIILNLKEELKKEPFREYEFEIPLKELDLPEEYMIDENEKLKVKIHLVKDKDDYIVSVAFDTYINVECARCLEPAKTKFAISESIILTKKPSKEQELHEEDLFTEYLEDEEHFNLNELIREEIIVNTPMKVLCSEDCKGLCPVCGANKNFESCDCEIKLRRKESPFAKLENLLKKS